jgi:mannose/fructose/N-acetylgalactosamine-specific phosphotransferase system component IID
VTVEEEERSPASEVPDAAAAPPLTAAPPPLAAAPPADLEPPLDAVPAPPPAPRLLRQGDLLAMGLRASLLQATWNYERQQGVGWAWALQPALRRLIPGAHARAERLAAHTAFFNTQPTMASIALGVVARMEEEGAARGAIDESAVRRTMGVMGSALAALGDRVFWFALRPVAACVGLMLIPFGPWPAAIALWLTYNLLHQGVRLGGVAWGYRDGPAAIAGPLRARLEGVRHGLMIGGVALVGVLFAALIAPGALPRTLGFQLALGGGLAFGLVASQRARPSPTEWALIMGGLAVSAAWAI